MHWLRERIYQIKTPAPNENSRENTYRNNMIEYERKSTVGIGRGTEDRNLALRIRSRWEGLQIGLCSKETKQDDSDLRWQFDRRLSFVGIDCTFELEGNLIRTGDNGLEKEIKRD